MPSWADTQISINDNDVEKLLRDCAIIPWGGGGVGKLEGGIGENDNKRGGVDVKFNAYRGGITFSFLFGNFKSSGRVIRVQI